jgi:hypothetical protein
MPAKLPMVIKTSVPLSITTAETSSLVYAGVYAIGFSPKPCCFLWVLGFKGLLGVLSYIPCRIFYADSTIFNKIYKCELFEERL